MEAKYCIVAVFWSCVVARIYAANQIKGLDDSILFRLNWPGTDTNLLDSPDYEKLVMTTTNNEQYQCLVPVNYGLDQDDGDVYSGPNALQVLMPLFTKQTCNLRLESYWTYELCHGVHLKQYREEREGKSTRLHEYTLGTLSLEDLQAKEAQLSAALKQTPRPAIPTTKVEGVDMPYFMINYTEGSVCDLTGRPRVSHVLFVCYEDGRHDIHSIKETFTCEYEIVVLSPYICQHPMYRPRELPQTDLHCVPMADIPKRPRNLLQIEAESLKLRSNGAILSGDTTSGSVKLEVLDEADQPRVVPPPAPDTPKHTPFPPQPAIDQKLVEDFLNGDYCLHGGSGWWRYEFCYGRKVEQYHEDRDGSKTVILLGAFHPNLHQAWITKHPEKAYKAGRRSVSHLYSGGDTCDVTGRPRQVEVKLKCKESQSPSSVTLYLLEPETCEYTLGVETPIICPLLPHADNLGLFSIDTHLTNGVGTFQFIEEVQTQPELTVRRQQLEEVAITQPPATDHLQEGAITQPPAADNLQDGPVEGQLGETAGVMEAQREIESEVENTENDVVEKTEDGEKVKGEMPVGPEGVGLDLNGL